MLETEEEVKEREQRLDNIVLLGVALLIVFFIIICIIIAGIGKLG